MGWMGIMGTMGRMGIVGIVGIVAAAQLQPAENRRVKEVDGMDRGYRNYRGYRGYRNYRNTKNSPRGEFFVWWAGLIIVVVIIVVIIVVVDSYVGMTLGVADPWTAVDIVVVDLIAGAAGVELELHTIREPHLVGLAEIVPVDLGIGDALTTEILLDIYFSCLGELVGSDDTVACEACGGHHQAHECCHEKLYCSHNDYIFFVYTFIILFSSLDIAKIARVSG